MLKSPPIIQIKHVTKEFPGVVALADVSFDVQPGEFHAIVGENGAGKSTLMKIISGVQTRYAGKFLLRGQPVAFRGTRDAEAAGVSIIHQELNLVDDLSVAANIFLGRERRTRFGLLDEQSMEQMSQELFRKLDCDIAVDQPVRALRVGDQQLVEIAKALAIESDVLIMDEPTSALTAAEVERLFRVIEQLLASGVTILYISHKMEEIFRCSHRITILRDGLHVQTIETALTNPHEVVHLMVGREIEETEIGSNRNAGEVVLEVEQLSLPWSGHARQWRLRDISFSLKQGEVLGIAGLMGAGRTELLEVLFGASKEAPEGVVRLQGKEVEFNHPGDALEAGFALVTEDRKRTGLFAELNVKENISICALGNAAISGWVLQKKERQMAEESVSLLDIKTSAIESGITTLSGGNQQKCIIARCLHTRPVVLLLDDPTRGIDVRAKAELYQVIDQLCESGLGIIMTSSELPELITLCDRILVLREGELTAEFERTQFSENAIIEAATQFHSTEMSSTP